ncbi:MULTISPECIES: hypothetical protein [Chelativorans]|nr:MULTISPECIES: hypothetical protein [Chelativorans]
MSSSATHSRGSTGAFEGRERRPDFHAQADRLALLVELSGGNLLGPPGGELLWLCDGLCRDATRWEQETSDERSGLTGGWR